MDRFGCRAPGLTITALLLSAASAAGQGTTQAGARLALGLGTPTETELAADVQFLADDVLAGRAPGTVGGDVAARFIAARFQALGLRPAGDNGSFFQRFDVVALTPRASFVVGGQRGTSSLDPATDFVAWSEQNESVTAVDGDLVFVGYGIDAPEWGWDDYKDVPVAGRILVFLVGDPGMQDTTRFRGRRGSYYGSVEYKLDQAARLGARGAVLVHRDTDTFMPWDAIVHTWGGERVRRAGPATTTLRVAAWLTEPALRRIAQEAGRDFDLMTRRASLPSFRPLSLGVHGVISVRNRVREATAANVLAMLPGPDTATAGGVVVVAAHYDHLGVGIPVGEDSVHNGAEDNASGTAALLSIARGWAAGTGGVQRSILFLATTAAESGRVGSQEFLRRTTVPAEHIVAVVNLDRLNLRGRTRDVIGLGVEESELDAVLRQAAGAEGLTVAPETGSAPEVYSIDHLSFARAGIPVLTLRTGRTFLERAESWGAERESAYLAHRFHRPSDAVDQETRYDGLHQQARVAVRVVWALATTTTFPKWKAEAEFRAAGERLELQRLRAAPRRPTR